MGPVHLLKDCVVRLISVVCAIAKPRVSSPPVISPLHTFPVPSHESHVGRAKASTAAAPRHESRKTTTPPPRSIKAGQPTPPQQNRDLKHAGFYGILRTFLPETHCVSPRTHHAGRRHITYHTRHTLTLRLLFHQIPAQPFPAISLPPPPPG